MRLDKFPKRMANKFQVYFGAIALQKEIVLNKLGLGGTIGICVK